MNLKGWNGIERWMRLSAKETSKVGVGIRPYGLHAGNMAAVVAYPYLLCEFFQQAKHQMPRFNMEIWFNDIEPVNYVGPDGSKETANAANMYPGSTTFQYMPAPGNFPGCLTDYWQPVIEGVVRGVVGAKFPEVKLSFRRASELVQTPAFQKMLSGALKKPEKIVEIINDNTRATLQGSHNVVWPLSPETHQPATDATFKKRFFYTTDKVTGTPINGGKRFSGNIEDLSWAMQFRMLQVARLASEQPNLWILGMDHYQTNRSNIMEELADQLELDRFKGNFLHVPLLYADGSKKISKSLGNAIYLSPFELIEALRANENNGLDVKHAPVSDDILILGSKHLPKHLKDNQRARLSDLHAKMRAYERSGKRRAFRRDNNYGAVSNREIASMVGVPHL